LKKKAGGKGQKVVWQIRKVSGKSRHFARCPGDFGQIIPLPVVLLGSFRENQPVVTFGVRLDFPQRKNKTVFLWIVG
jgi:hypothetical protein